MNVSLKNGTAIAVFLQVPSRGHPLPDRAVAPVAKVTVLKEMGMLSLDPVEVNQISGLCIKTLKHASSDRPEPSERSLGQMAIL